MFLFLKSIGAILAKSQVLTVLSNFGFLAAGIGIFMAFLPSFPVWIAAIAIIVLLGLVAMYAGHKLLKHKGEVDMQVAEARTKAAKAEREMFAAKARASASKTCADHS